MLEITKLAESGKIGNNWGKQEIINLEKLFLGSMIHSSNFIPYDSYCIMIHEPFSKIFLELYGNDSNDHCVRLVNILSVVLNHDKPPMFVMNQIEVKL